MDKYHRTENMGFLARLHDPSHEPQHSESDVNVILLENLDGIQDHLETSSQDQSLSKCDPPNAVKRSRLFSGWPNAQSHAVRFGVIFIALLLLGNENQRSEPLLH